MTVVHDFEGPNPGFDATASVEGYRYVRIHAGTGPGGSYTLSPYLAETFEVDQYEPNNSMAEATPLPWGSIVVPTLFPGIDVGIAVPDTDYFSVQGVAGEIGLFRYSQQGGGEGSRATPSVRPIRIAREQRSPVTSTTGYSRRPTRTISASTCIEKPAATGSLFSRDWRTSTACCMIQPLYGNRVCTHRRLGEARTARRIACWWMAAST